MQSLRIETERVVGYPIEVAEVVVAEYGEPGSVIPGSCLYRWYCWDCRTPIRVATVPQTVRETVLYRCEECSGRKRELIPGGYAGPVDEDSDGSYGNRQRAMEGI